MDNWTRTKNFVFSSFHQYCKCKSRRRPYTERFLAWAQAPPRLWNYSTVADASPTVFLASSIILCEKSDDELSSCILLGGFLLHAAHALLLALHGFHLLHGLLHGRLLHAFLHRFHPAHRHLARSRPNESIWKFESYHYLL